MRADVRFKGVGQVQVQLLDDDGVTRIGGTVGLSELVVLKDRLKPDDNPECQPDIKIGDTVIHLTPCKTIGSGFAMMPTNRVLNTDPASGVALFEKVFVGDVKVEGVNSLQRRRQRQRPPWPRPTRRPMSPSRSNPPAW